MTCIDIDYGTSSGKLVLKKRRFTGPDWRVQKDFDIVRLLRNSLVEYEQLYIMRDQAMLFLKMMPDTQGYINEVLATLDDMVDTLGRRLTVVKD